MATHRAALRALCALALGTGTAGAVVADDQAPVAQLLATQAMDGTAAVSLSGSLRVVKLGGRLGRSDWVLESVGTNTVLLVRQAPRGPERLTLERGRPQRLDLRPRTFAEDDSLAAGGRD